MNSRAIIFNCYLFSDIIIILKQKHITVFINTFYLFSGFFIIDN